MQALESPPAPLPSDLPPPALDDRPHGERLLWLARIADSDPHGLAGEVLDRIDLTGVRTPLLGLEAADRCRLARHFGVLTSRRLSTLPVDLQHYVRLVGDPIEATRRAFEQRGELEIAAACHALVHDKLASRDEVGHLASLRADLRFCCARCLAEARPREREACRTMVAAIVESTDSDGAKSPGLRGAMIAWLADG